MLNFFLLQIFGFLFTDSIYDGMKPAQHLTNSPGSVLKANLTGKSAEASLILSGSDQFEEMPYVEKPQE